MNVIQTSLLFFFIKDDNVYTLVCIRLQYNIVFVFPFFFF